MNFVHRSYRVTFVYITVLACDDGWVQGNSDSCYKFVKTKATWADAQKACRGLGGDLVALESVHEIYWMRGYRSSHADLRATAWTSGLLDKDGVWKWQYGEETNPIESFNWAIGQPDKFGAGGSKASCLSLFGEMSMPEANYHFDDDGCSVKNGYICEKF